MSAPHHLPQRHLNLLPSPPYKTSSLYQNVRPSIADRFSQVLHDIEVFLLACTYEEMSNFWAAIASLRQAVQKRSPHLEVPRFLTDRKKHRDFCRILEVLADLTYPQLHLSNHLSERSSDRRSSQSRFSSSAFAHPHLAIQK